MSTFLNLFNNPSAQRSLTGYSVTGTGTIALNAGNYTVATATASQASGTFGTLIEQYTIGSGISANTTYTYSATISGNATTVGVHVGNTGVTSATVSNVSGFNLVSITFTTFSSGIVSLYVVNTAAVVSGNTVAFFNAKLEPGAVATPYFDGSYPSAAWSGTADNSFSELWVPTWTLTPVIDTNPSPRVQWQIVDFAPQVATINVTRVAEGRTYRVRGGVNLAAVGGAAGVDNEVPFGVAMSYRAEQFTSAGVSLGFTNTASATIASSSVAVDSSHVWISQPLKPTLAILATMRVESLASVSRPNPGQLLFPEGATVGTFIGSQRQGLSQMPLLIECANAADADEFLSMFGSYSSDFPPILCFRSLPPTRIPRTLFAACSAPVEVTDYSQPTPYITFQMTVDEVQPPSPGLVIPLLRREDLNAAYTTRAALNAAYATRLAADTDYTKAGLAGP